MFGHQFVFEDVEGWENLIGYLQEVAPEAAQTLEEAAKPHLQCKAFRETTFLRIDEIMNTLQTARQQLRQLTYKLGTWH